MNDRKPISLPRFAQPIFHTWNSCRFCKAIIREHDLLFVGVGRDKDGNPCFAFEYRCPSCHQYRTVVDTEHRFTTRDWWDEIVAWQKTAQHFEYVSYFASKAWWDLPKIGPMNISDDPPGPVWIRGGYKGEIGPVVLLYEGTKDQSIAGAMRLERRQRVSLLSEEDDAGLPWLKTKTFAELKDGETFAIGGRDWTKMPVGEIEEIIRDQVFAVIPDPDNFVTTPLENQRSGHEQKARKTTRRRSPKTGP